MQSSGNAASAKRPVQADQTAQRKRAMGKRFGSNRHHQQWLQMQMHQQMQAAAMAKTGETPMEVDAKENTVQSKTVAQIKGTARSNTDDSCMMTDDESIVYLIKEIEDPANAVVQQQITGNIVIMLFIMENGEQRLITFELSKETCTVQDLLKIAMKNDQTLQNPRVSLVSDTVFGINYIVELTPENDQKEQYAESDNEISNTTFNSRFPLTSNHTSSANSQTTPAPRVPKYVKRLLALCPFCGMRAADFNYCMRCKRKLPENVKAVPIINSTPVKNESALPPKSPSKKVKAPKVAHDAGAGRGQGKGRGRGRGKTRVTKQNKKPECLTISSDQEDDGKIAKKAAQDLQSTNLQSSVNSGEGNMILVKKPIITDNLPESSNFIHAGQETEKPSRSVPANNISTNLTCRTVRIGSYKYVPHNDIQISSSGLKLVVPCLENDKSFITVNIKYAELVKVLIHFSRTIPVLFFYTSVMTGLRVRDLLNMRDSKGPYFDPASRDQTQKRITLLPEEISDASKAALKELYRAIYEELDSKEVHDILVKSSPKLNWTQKTQVQIPIEELTSTSSTDNADSNGAIQTITVYPPPPTKGGIAINVKDFTCLGEDHSINDIIIDFYLRYLILEVLSEADHKRTHVFSSYFYNRLTSPQIQALENVENLSAAARRHVRVQKWTKNVNIFEKDFVVIPINRDAHWSLAIVCFPGLVGKVLPQVDQKALDKKKKDSRVKSLTIGNTTITLVSTITSNANDGGLKRDEAEGDDEEIEADSDAEEAGSETEGEQTSSEPTSKTKPPPDQQVTKAPCILIFGSLAGSSKSKVVATLRDYLHCEYQAKTGMKQMFTKETVRGASPTVPKLSNLTDCGLYVLQIVESFFQSPITDYTLPIKTLKTWFEEISVTRKREELAELLTTLMNKTNGSEVINLPSLIFPTQNGKLKQKPEMDAEATKPTARKRKAAEPNKSQTSSATSLNNAITSNETATSTFTPQQSIPQTSLQPTDVNTAKSVPFPKIKRKSRSKKSSEYQENKWAVKKYKRGSSGHCK